MTEEQEKAPEGGCFSTGLLLFSGIGGIITLVSAVNVALDLDLSLRVYGSTTELPTDWFAVIALAIVCGIAFGIYTLMTSLKVRKQFRARPWLKWATPLAILLVLSSGFYAVYYNIEYAGPLHYAARSNDLETINELLQEEVDDDDYDEAVYECVELDHVKVLKALLEHPVAKESLEENYTMGLNIASMGALLAFADAGLGSEGKYGDVLAEFLAVSDLSIPEKEKVGLKLLEVGASPDGLYTGGYKSTELTALEQARQQGLRKLVDAMEN